MSIIAGTGGVSGVWTTYINKKFVDMLTPNKVIAKFAEPAQLPKQAGGYVARWNIPQRLAGVTTALTEASATAGEIANTTISSVEATVSEYGQWMKVSDLAADTNIRGTLDVYAEQFSDAAIDTIELKCAASALTTTNYLYADEKAANIGTMTTADIATAQTFVAIGGFFNGQNARGHSSIGGRFAWFIHPDQEVDIQAEVTTDALSWSNVKMHTPEGYKEMNSLDTKMVGSLGQVCAFRTTNIGTVTETVNTYQSFALARHGVGFIDLDNAKPQDMGGNYIKIKRPGPNDTSQPLDMYQTIGYKIRAQSRLLDASRALVVYSAV